VPGIGSDSDFFLAGFFARSPTFPSLERAKKNIVAKFRVKWDVAGPFFFLGAKLLRRCVD
jgi:hypothetical protein